VRKKCRQNVKRRDSLLFSLFGVVFRAVAIYILVNKDLYTNRNLPMTLITFQTISQIQSWG